MRLGMLRSSLALVNRGAEKSVQIASWLYLPWECQRSAIAPATRGVSRQDAEGGDSTGNGHTGASQNESKVQHPRGLKPSN